MAITKIHKRRVPLDGTPFLTTVHLASLIRRQPGEHTVPDSLSSAYVPAWVRMEPDHSDWMYAYSKYDYPHGIIFRPVVKLLGCDHNTEIECNRYDANLERNGTIELGRGHGNTLHYIPFGEYDPKLHPGEETSIYSCNWCKNTLQHDPAGVREYSDSAMLGPDGKTMICRNCEARGLVYGDETNAQIERCIRLAKFVGGDAERSLHRSLEFMQRQGDEERQTRLWKEDDFSFYWRDTYFRPDGAIRLGMHGGLIMHGPYVRELEPGNFEFSEWSSELGREVPAREDRIKGISWSIHT